jgi:hypothetical protein
VVKDRIARYAEDADRRAYLEGIARGNAAILARLRAGGSAVPVVPAPEVAGGGEADGRPLNGRDAPPDRGRPADGDRAEGTEGFSSYSAVGHYVPESVGEESQRG